MIGLLVLNHVVLKVITHKNCSYINQNDEYRIKITRRNIRKNKEMFKHKSK